MKAAHIVVPLFFIPGHAAAIVRIAAAIHGNLVRVIDARCTGETDQQSRSRFHQRLVAASNAQHPLNIVAADLIELLQRDDVGNRRHILSPLQCQRFGRHRVRIAEWLLFGDAQGRRLPTSGAGVY